MMAAQGNRPSGGPVTAFVTDCGNAIAELVDGVFAVIRPLADAVHAVFHDHRRVERPVTSNDLASLQHAAFDVLDRRHEFDSAGYAFAPGAVVDRQLYLDWWHRSPEGGYAPVVLDLDPSSADVYDYPQLEWYSGAADSGGRFSCGPIVDETLTHSYVVTFTRPVVVRDELVGVIGTDVAMTRLEHLLIRPLRRIAAEAVLVNRDRRVIASNCATWTTGEKLPSHPSDDPDTWQIVVPVTPDLGWSLAVHRPGNAAHRVAAYAFPDTR